MQDYSDSIARDGKNLGKIVQLQTTTKQKNVPPCV